MGRLSMAAIAGVLLLVTSVWANSGPPQLPKDQKFVVPSMRFDRVEIHEDWVFYLHYNSYFIGPFTSLIEVRDSKAFPLEFKAMGTWKDRKVVIEKMSLLAIERKAFDERKAADPTLKWLDDKTPGVLAANIKPPATSAPISSTEIPAHAYRVAMIDGKLTADKIEDGKGEKGLPTGLLPTWGFGIISSLSIAWLGIWFARRGTSAALASLRE